MSKSTLESLEKLLAKFVAPIEEKLNNVLQEVRILRDKIEKNERKEAIISKKQADPPENIKTVTDDSATTLHTLPAAKQRQAHAHFKTTGSTDTTTPPSNSASVRSAPAPPVRVRASPRPNATATAPVRIHAPSSTDTTQAPTTAAMNNSDAEGWEYVSRGRKSTRRGRTVVKGSGIEVSELRTVERARKIHICFLAPDTTADSILSYMKRKKQCDSYNVEKLKLAHSHYSSFAISVPYSHFEFFMSAENWPLRIEISEWFRRSGGRAGDTPRQRRHARSRAVADIADTDSSAGAVPTSALASASDARKSFITK